MKQSYLLIIGLVVLLLVGGAVVLSMQRNGTTPTTDTTQTVPAAQNTGLPESSPTLTADEEAAKMKLEEAVGAKTFVVSGSNFAFDVKEMNVKKGDTVKVTFKNVEGFHDWVVDEFNAKTKQLQAGAEETITFVADKAGTFEYYCSVGKHRQNGMVGKLIVEE